VCACVCVCERETKQERERKRERERERKKKRESRKLRGERAAREGKRQNPKSDTGREIERQ